MNFLRNIYEFIKNHFLLRNIVLAICGIIIFLFVVSIILNIATRHGQRHIVPELVGKSLTQAQQLSEEASLRIEVIDSLFVPKQAPGVILDQSPDASMGVKAGRRVFVVINAHRPPMDVVPYVTGYSLRQAKNMLESKGFEIAKLVYRPDMATNNVLDEHYNGRQIVRSSNIKAELGDAITLTVGQNSSSPLPLVPKVIGLTLREAKSRLWEMGLNCGALKSDNSVNAQNQETARVYRQLPAQQSRADYGSQVTLYLTADGSKVSSGSRDSDHQARQVAKSVLEEEEGIE